MLVLMLPAGVPRFVHIAVGVATVEATVGAGLKGVTPFVVQVNFGLRPFVGAKLFPRRARLPFWLTGAA